MNFNSLEFLLFLPIVVSLYWILPSRFRWCLLLFASYYFYMRWNAKLIVLILGVTGITYLAGLLVEKTDNKGIKRMITAAAVVLCLAVLFYFKYFNFLADSINAVTKAFNSGKSIIVPAIVLPVGISFYTFQALSYVIDVYRRQTAAERHFGYYALFVSFFPQLVAGPIERVENLLPQLKSRHELSKNDIKAGLLLLLSGFFRKVAVADVAGVFVTKVFSDSEVSQKGAAVLLAALLFSVQIYCDFAGYSEIASGSARLMGIRLMRNFNQPYAATGIRDFWKRWHISLTGWFKDYIYIPMGGSRHGRMRQLFAILTVFLVSGLWHGASWTFVIWGLFHAVCYIVEKPLDSLIQTGLHGRSRDFERAALRVRNIFTIGLVSFSWIFFRAGSMQQAVSMIFGITKGWSLQETLTCLGMGAADVLHIGLCLLMLPALNKLTASAFTGEALKPFGNAYVLFLFQLLMVTALSWLLRLESNTINSFIYFQF